MKTPSKILAKILAGTVLAAIAALSLGACSDHERTVVERPVATAPATVVVPDRQPTTVVVLQKKPDVVVVPNNG